MVHSGLGSAFAGQVALQRGEPAAPELPVWREPRVDLGERLGTQPVNASLRVDACLDETGIPQHAQVLRDSWLVHIQRFHQLADREVLLAQEVEDATATGFGEDLEEGSGHGV